jgi:hypothetical protein
MPIFQGQIHSLHQHRFYVAETHACKIVADRKPGRSRKYPLGTPIQMTAYSVYVEVSSPQAICYVVLPFPVGKGRNRCGMLDMAQYPDFFLDLDLMFPIHGQSSLQRSLLADEEAQSAERPDSQLPRMKILSQQRCGTVSQLYDQQYLTPDTIGICHQYYGSGFAFWVLAFQPAGARLNGWLGPLAYVHEISRGRDPSITTLFIPTRHYLRQAPRTDRYRYADGETPVAENPFDRTETPAEHDQRWLDMYQRRRIQVGAPKPTRPVAEEGLLGPTNVAGPEDSPWDHQVYVLNRRQVLGNPLLQSTGVRISPADPTQLTRVDMYLQPAKMPTKVYRGPVHDVHRIELNSTYKRRLDLLL